MKSILLLAALALPVVIGCNSKPTEPNTNQQAALTGPLPYNPLAWKPITSSINERDATMSTLYGNDIAVQFARTNPSEAYPAGAILSLVTWQQRDDPHWFGARIPSTVKAVEFITIPTTPNQKPTYELFQGSPLQKATIADDTIVSARIEDLLTQRAAVMP